MKKILIINANYYNDITKRLVASSKKVLKMNNTNIFQIEVPGVFEIPFALRKNIKKFDGFVALGCVIKGDTPHFEFICESSFKAIVELSIIYNKPIGNGIITALNLKQAQKRCGIIKSRKVNKGTEAAKAVLSLLKNEPKKT
tara:strand:+ start:339 stop:764 length:426 start_codon:yes stop_codon:yes gene_type:complete